MDDTLKAVLRHVKATSYDNDWKDLRDQVFASLYHPDMAFLDVFQVLLHTYERAVMEPRFELPGGYRAAEELILSPVKGPLSIDHPFPKNGLETQYSVEKFYGAMMKWMLSNLRLTRVDWCREELGLTTTTAVLSD